MAYKRLRGVVWEDNSAVIPSSDPFGWENVQPPAPTNAEVAAGEVAEATSPAAPPPKQGMMGIDFMSPMGLGAIGLIGGYIAGKGKRAKTRYALVGGAVGAAAAYFMSKK
jgi:hypothetical protein